MQQKYIDDIEFLINKLEEIHPDLYFSTSKTEIKEMISIFKSNNKPIDDNQFYYILKILFKKIGDPHTMVRFKKKVFPLVLKIINNKVYIINTSNENKHNLFSEITFINGVPILDIMKELEKTISYTTNGYLEYLLEFYLTEYYSLLPLISGNETITYTVEKDGISNELKFDSKDEFSDDFTMTKPYWFNYNQEKNTLVINYKSCREDENKTMNEFVNEVSLFVDEYNIVDIIVDIRGNQGGNSNIIKPLIEYLSTKSLNLITLIDKGVYSSGRWALIDLKHLGSKFIGTEIGTQLNCFGNCENFELPNTKIKISCSKTYWYYDGKKIRGINKENFFPFKEDKENKKYFLPSNFLPDIYIENTIEDYEINYDRQLDTALGTIKQSKVFK